MSENLMPKYRKHPKTKHGRVRILNHVTTLFYSLSRNLCSDFGCFRLFPFGFQAMAQKPNKGCMRMFGFRAMATYHSKSRPLLIQTRLDDPKPKHVWYSDLHCIYLAVETSQYVLRVKVHATFLCVQ